MPSPAVEVEDPEGCGREMPREPGHLRGSSRAALTNTTLLGSHIVDRPRAARTLMIKNEQKCATRNGEFCCRILLSVHLMQWVQCSSDHVQESEALPHASCVDFYLTLSRSPVAIIMGWKIKSPPIKITLNRISMSSASTTLPALKPHATTAVPSGGLGG